MGQLQGFFYCTCHAGFRHGDTQLVHNLTELVTVLRQVDDFRGSSQNVHALFLQLGRQVQRSLPTELGDDPYRFFFIVNAEHVF